MKSEMSLIRLLTEMNITKEKKVKINDLLQKKLDWGYFINEIFNNKVTNIIFYNLKKMRSLEEVPYYVYKILNTYWNSTVLKSNTYFLYIEDIACKLNRLNIPYAFIKGFDLIDKLYVDNSAYIREFNDLDILVNESDLEQIEVLLKNDGYVYGDYNVNLDRIEKAHRFDIVRMKMDSHQIYSLVKKVNYCEGSDITGPVVIDVNFTIFDGGRNSDPIKTKLILQNRVFRKSFNNIEYYSLDEYYTFLQLVYHLYRESKFDLLKKEKLDLTLHKFGDINNYLIYISDKWSIEKMKNIIYQYNLLEAFWFVLYFTDLLYGTKYLNVFLEEDVCYLSNYTEYILYFKEKYQLN